MKGSGIIKTVIIIAVIIVVIGFLALIIPGTVEKFAFKQFGIKLQYKFNTGDELKYAMGTAIIYNIKKVDLPNVPRGSSPFIETWRELGSQKQMAQETQLLYTEKVKSYTPDGIAQISFQVNDAKIRETRGLVSIENAPMENILKGANFLLKLNSLGEVTDFQSSSLLPGNTDPSGMKSLFTSGNATFPDKKLRAGSSWEQTVELPIATAQLSSNGTYKYTYTLEGLENFEKITSVLIKIRLSMDQVVKSNASNMEVTITTKGSGEGTTYFDYKRGRLLQTITNAKLENTITFESVKNPSEKGKINFDNNMLIQYKLMEDSK
ncbi:MAG: DUF6263 family protein [Firmicutes bacterium]|nr:DUF6263 family protein [Bacillota bacterium]